MWSEYPPILEPKGNKDDSTSKSCAAGKYCCSATSNSNSTQEEEGLGWAAPI